MRPLVRCGGRPPPQLAWHGRPGRSSPGAEAMGRDVAREKQARPRYRSLCLGGLPHKPWRQTGCGDDGSRMESLGVVLRRHGCGRTDRGRLRSLYRPAPQGGTQGRHDLDRARPPAFSVEVGREEEPHCEGADDLASRPPRAPELAVDESAGQQIPEIVRPAARPAFCDPRHDDRRPIWRSTRSEVGSYRFRRRPDPSSRPGSAADEQGPRLWCR